MNTGKVYLIGAGPGDPGLITVKGLNCVRTADVVVYDRLANPGLLREARNDARKIFVGKRSGHHSATQDEINRIIVEEARSGKVVARLKGGDPFIFGRGGEEAEVLRQNGIPFEIVPGVSSAIAAPAYAGIPLTHRDYVSSVSIVTGHEDPSKLESSINWASLATATDTLVFLMGMENLGSIANKLMSYGKPKDTPVALVRWGTTARQQVLSSTLEKVASDAQKKGFGPPAVIIVGRVVELREQLHWWEDKPLAGKRILVTRARAQASGLTGLIEENGGEAYEFPTIETVPLDDYAPLLDAIGQPPDYYGWVVFTSVNGVHYFYEQLMAAGADSRWFAGKRVAAIGSATAQRLKEFGIIADVVPEEFRAEGIVAAIPEEQISGKRFLIPRALEAREVLVEELSRKGAVVHNIPVYKTVLRTEGSEEVRRMLASGEFDAVTFTSSSTVRNFVSALGEQDSIELLAGVSVVCIGPVTAETAASLGIKVDAVAGEYTIPGLVQALCGLQGRSRMI